MEGNDFNWFRGQQDLLNAFNPPPDPPANPQVTKKKRSKFGPVRRKEVKDTRQKGACIKCHMSKITVSPPDSDLQSRTRSSGVYAVLWWTPMRVLQQGPSTAHCET